MIILATMKTWLQKTKLKKAKLQKTVIGHDTQIMTFLAKVMSTTWRREITLSTISSSMSSEKDGAHSQYYMDMSGSRKLIIRLKRVIFL